MITDLPVYVYATFMGAVIYSIIRFYFASNRNLKFTAGLILWASLHIVLAFSGFYENTKTIPPRLMLLVFPVMIIILSSIFSSKMKNWLGSLNLKQLMYLHAVRIPVELTLFWLFTANYVPELMTFEGRNFDIIAGISGLIVAYYAFRNNRLNRPLLWIWNIGSILLLSNIIISALLSTPTVIQQMAFEQPNIAILKFPFLLLPVIIVPLVMISNIAAFVILKRSKY